MRKKKAYYKLKKKTKHYLDLAIKTLGLAILVSVLSFISFSMCKARTLVYQRGSHFTIKDIDKSKKIKYLPLGWHLNYNTFLDLVSNCDKDLIEQYGMAPCPNRGDEIAIYTSIKGKEKELRLY